MNRLKKFLFFLSLILAVMPASFQINAAQSQKKRDYLEPVLRINSEIRKRLGSPIQKLDVDLIMEGSDFFGTMPYYIRWDSDDSRLWFRWKQWYEKKPGTYEYAVSTKKLKRLCPDEAEKVPGPDAVWDRTNRFSMWRVNNTVWLYDGHNKTSVPICAGIGGVPEQPEYALLGGPYLNFHEDIPSFDERAHDVVYPLVFTEDSSKAVLFYNNNLLTINLGQNRAAGRINQITDIRTGFSPCLEPPTKAQKHYKRLQLEMFEVINSRYKNKESEEAYRQKRSPRTLYLEDWNVLDLIPSSDLEYAALILHRYPSNARLNQVPNFNTLSGYVELMSAYRKGCEELPDYKLGIMELETGGIKWVDFGFEEKKLIFLDIKWSPEGKKALVGFSDLGFKDAWLGVLTPKPSSGIGGSGRAGSIGLNESRASMLSITETVLAHDFDPAFIHPLAMRYIGWYPSGEKVWFSSERSGYLHLYSMVPKNGSEIEALTSGSFPIFRPHLSPDGAAIILNAEIPDPFEMQSFLLPLEGEELTAITSGCGRTEGKISPEGRYFAYIGSSSNKPWELYIKPMDSKGRGTKVTDSPSPSYKSYNWKKPEIIHFTAQDGAQVPARLYRPAMPHPDNPAVIFAHGAGWLHNVHRWWPSYSKEHCFHYLLMEKGYTIMDIDFRGSAGYGRNWSTATYRKETAGITSDVADGSRYLVKTLNTDPEQIGIYGGSGGGVITLHALFQYPDHFGAGAALRPLPDYFHYDFWGPRTVLGDPYENPEAYINASPLYHAEGLTDPLLICIGLSDTNTHFQGVVRLVQRLIELRKSGWELAVYPMESHSFKEPSSWSDEYRRILELFEKNLKKSGNE